MTAYPTTLKEVAVTVPFLISVAEVVFTIFPMKHGFKVLKLDAVFLVDIAVGLLDITDDVLAGGIGQRVALDHGTEEFFHRHDMRADMLGVKTGACA